MIFMNQVKYIDTYKQNILYQICLLKITVKIFNDKYLGDERSQLLTNEEYIKI
jgi:hypothetical protein